MVLKRKSPTFSGPTRYRMTTFTCPVCSLSYELADRGGARHLCPSCARQLRETQFALKTEDQIRSSMERAQQRARLLEWRLAHLSIEVPPTRTPRASRSQGLLDEFTQGQSHRDAAADVLDAMLRRDPAASS